jgi:alginate O-acetyltransferase complex protein AlgI
MAVEEIWKSRVLDWLPLTLFPTAAVACRSQLSPWVFMWLMALSIFGGCKWVTWRRALKTSPRPSIPRTLSYLLLWPGMDAMAFLNPKATFREGKMLYPRSALIYGCLSTVLGGLLIWAATVVVILLPEVAGWMTMTGVALILHFGLFKLLALLWQRAGIPVLPVMRQPLKASSLAEFWSGRWNTAFTGLVHDLALRPLVRRLGINGAILGVFLISGLVHELVISLPARGGLGLPTGYFLLQGLGVILAREGRRWGLNKGIRGRIYTALFTVGPVYWLFHPFFVQNVILPMLAAIVNKGGY